MSRRELALAGGIGLVGALAFAGMRAPGGPWLIDDAAITYAYAESLARGFGLALGPERMPVEGFSNPLLVALCALAAWGGLLHPFLFHAALEAVEFGLMLVVAWRLLGQVALSARRAIAATALFGTLQLATPACLLWYGSGLENLQLSLGLVLLALRAHRALREPLSPLIDGALAVAVSLVRPEAVLYPAAALIAVIVLGRPFDATRRRRLVQTAVVVGGALLGLLVLRRMVTGAWLPNTFYAKNDGSVARNVWEYVAPWLLTYAATPYFITLVLLARRRSPARATLGILLALTAVALALPVQAGRDWMGEHRFGTAFLTAAQLSFVVAFAAAANPLAPLRLRLLHGRWAGLALMLAPLPGLVVWGVPRFVRLVRAPHSTFDTAVDSVGFVRFETQQRLGLAEPVLAVPDLGGSSLVGQARIVDTLMLADFHMARLRRNWLQLSRYQQDERQVDLVEWHRVGKFKYEWLEQGYVRTARFRLPQTPEWAEYWVRRPLVTTTAEGARFLGQAASLALWVSPRTVWQVAPGGVARVEILLALQGGYAPALHPDTRLRVHSPSDAEVLPLLAGLESSEATAAPDPQVTYRQGFLVYAPSHAGRVPVTLDVVGPSGNTLASFPCGVLDVRTLEPADVAAVVAAQAPVVERARRLAALEDQLRPRLPRAERARALSEFRARAVERSWRLLHAWDRLWADIEAARAPAPAAVAAARARLRDEVVAALRDEWSRAPEPDRPLVLLRLGRRVEELRRTRVYGVAAAMPEVVAGGRQTAARAPDPDARYRALAGLSMLDPADVNVHRALLDARRAGEPLPK